MAPPQLNFIVGSATEDYQIIAFLIQVLSLKESIPLF